MPQRVLLGTMIAAALVAWLPEIAQGDDEMAAFVASRRAAMTDPTAKIADRERVALDVAAALDRSALSSVSEAIRRDRWSQSAALLDEFSRLNPDHPRRRLFALRSAIAIAARGRSFGQDAAVAPTDRTAGFESRANLDDAITRLRPLHEATGDELTPEIRFRLARDLADRAALASSKESTLADRRDALKVLGESLSKEPVLRGYTELLRAEILAGLGRFDDAKQALDRSASADPATPSEDRLEVQIPIAVGQGRPAEALSVIEASGLPPGRRGLLAVQLRLAEWGALKPGGERVGVEVDAFQRAAELRKTGAAETRRALIALARTLDEPTATASDEAWELMAEGAVVLGQPDRAVRLLIVGASRSEAHKEGQKAANWRFRAGGIAFQAGRFERAAALFTRVVDDPNAAELRAKAGMLCALSLGRVAASAEPGRSESDYVAALVDQIQRFPDDPATGEARWLLGLSRLASGDRLAAERLWESIPKTHPRWIDGQVARVDRLRDDLDAGRLVLPAGSLRPRLDAARKAAERLHAEARDDAERAEVALLQARIELEPLVGEPPRALATLDAVLRLPLRDDQRDRGRMLRIVALARSDRLLDAETAARNIDPATEPAAVITMVRELDRAATASESEGLARRLGGIERIVADRLETFKLANPQQAEIPLRRARGRMIAGDRAGAKAILDSWSEPGPLLVLLGPEVLADLADLEEQLDEPGRAAATFRRAANAEANGSPRWLRDRLGQARNLDQSGKTEAARKLLEGTALLHPELGGPIMKARYATLRGKLDRKRGGGAGR